MNIDNIIKNYNERISYLSKIIPKYDYESNKRKSKQLRNAYFVIYAIVFIATLSKVGLMDALLLAFVSGLLILGAYMVMTTLVFNASIEETTHLQLMQQELKLLKEFTSEIEAQEVFNELEGIDKYE